MDYNDNDFAKTYLAKMDQVKFLSKDEQLEIGREIKKNETLILESCVKFLEFRKQLLTLKVVIKRNENNIIKLSKELSDSSKPKTIANMRTSFSKLFEALEDGTDDECIKYLTEVNLSSSTINQLLMPIKERHTILESYEQQIERIFKFLEVDELDQVFEIEKDLADHTKRRVICRKLHTTESRIGNYINEAKEVVKFLDQENLTTFSINELKTLYKNITSLESKVQEQRSKLIESCLPLVINRAKRFTDQGLDFEDLVQEGNIGLMKAVDKYEPTKDIKVTTYASWWIDQAIRRAISNKAKTVRIPIHIQDTLQKINRAYHHLCHALKREPTHEDIAEYSGLKLKVITDLFMTAQHEVGLDEEVTSGVSYQDIIPDGSSTAFSKVSKTMLHGAIRRALAQLKPRDEKILRLRFGIGESNDHTLEEIGKQYGITRERVRQVERRALRTFKENINDPAK